MSQLRTSVSAFNATEGASTGVRAFGIVEWLHLAATPTFAAMALLTGVAGNGPANMLCSAAHGMSPLSGMAMMYLLMAAFHAVPWLKLISARRRKAADGLTSRAAPSRLP
jgi:hypothetical protein